MLDCHGPTFHIVPSFHLVNRQIVADFDIFRAVELCRNSISTGSKLRTVRPVLIVFTVARVQLST
jgi:hypothetical protein